MHHNADSSDKKNDPQFEKFKTKLGAYLKQVQDKIKKLMPPGELKVEVKKALEESGMFPEMTEESKEKSDDANEAKRNNLLDVENYINNFQRAIYQNPANRQSALEELNLNLTVVLAVESKRPKTGFWSHPTTALIGKISKLVDSQIKVEEKKPKSNPSPS